MVKRNHKLDKQETNNWNQCIAAPNRDYLVNKKAVRGSKFQQPPLEFNGACPECGEPAIIKLLTQLYDNQLYLANASGCSLVWSATF